jgi:hypothetical protein
MLPIVQSGCLELVRTVVAQAIPGLAGTSTSEANSSLAYQQIAGFLFCITGKK